MCVIIGTHLYTRGFIKAGVAMHVVNFFQIIRLLATRGHYSIDLIIGWVVAVYVSNPAERMGKYFSRGTPESIQLFPEVTAEGIFEVITGVKDVKLGGGYNSTDHLTHTQNISTLKLGRTMAEDAYKSGAQRMRQIEPRLADAYEKARGGLTLSQFKADEVRERFNEEVRQRFSTMNRDEMVRALSAAASMMAFGDKDSEKKD